MLYRNLMYTGFSRAKELLVLVGSERAIATAVQNDARQRRRAMLTDRADRRRRRGAAVRAARVVCVE